MKKSFVGLLSAVLAVSALAAPPTFAQQAAATSATVALGFETMAAVSGAYVGSANPIRDIPDGGLPWIISSATGELRADGQLTVSVIWCLRPLTPCRVTCKAPIRRRLSMRLLAARASTTQGLQCWPAYAQQTRQRARAVTQTFQQPSPFPVPALRQSCLSRAAPESAAGSPRRVLSRSGATPHTRFPELGASEAVTAIRVAALGVSIRLLTRMDNPPRAHRSLRPRDSHWLDDNLARGLVHRNSGQHFPAAKIDQRHIIGLLVRYIGELVV